MRVLEEPSLSTNEIQENLTLQSDEAKSYADIERKHLFTHQPCLFKTQVIQRDNMDRFWF
jgi:hypothetical protein